MIENAEKIDETKAPAGAVVAFVPPGEAHAQVAGKREWFYYPKQDRFFTTNSKGDWVSINEGTARLMLIQSGFSDKLTKAEKDEGVQLTEVDIEIVDIKTERIVSYAGIVAGSKRGFKKMNGSDVLITHELDIIKPRQAVAEAPSRADGTCRGWPTLGGQFERWLCSKGWGSLKDQFGRRAEIPGAQEAAAWRPEDEGFDQRDYFFAWLARWYGGVLEGERSLGHAVVFSGGTGCGKTFMVTLLEAIFGGAAAQPYAYLMGGQFNRDVVSSTVLTIDDEVSKTDMKSRKDLGARVKQFVAVPKMRIEGKGADAVILSMVNRLIFCTNLTEDNLSVLPPPSEDLIDADGRSGKMMMFKFYSHGWEEPAATRVAQAAFFKRLVGELPAFLWWLLNEFELPANLYDDRFGVVPWMHPEMLEKLEELSPWQRILSLIDRVLFAEGGRERWVVTSETLHELLTNEDSKLPAFEKQALRASYLHLDEIAQKRPLRCVNLRGQARGALRAYVLYRDGARTDSEAEKRLVMDELKLLIAKKKGAASVLAPDALSDE